MHVGQEIGRTLNIKCNVLKLFDFYKVMCPYEQLAIYIVSVRFICLSHVSPVMMAMNSSSLTATQHYICIFVLTHQSYGYIVVCRLKLLITDNLKVNLMYAFQSGFRFAHSTDIALTFLADKLRANMDEGLYTGMVLIDLQKAFDTVDYTILSKKTKRHRG